MGECGTKASDLPGTGDGGNNDFEAKDQACALSCAVQRTQRTREGTKLPRAGIVCLALHRLPYRLLSLWKDRGELLVSLDPGLW